MYGVKINLLYGFKTLEAELGNPILLLVVALPSMFLILILKDDYRLVMSCLPQPLLNIGRNDDSSP